MKELINEWCACQVASGRHGDFLVHQFLGNLKNINFDLKRNKENKTKQKNNRSPLSLGNLKDIHTHTHKPTKL
jgi:hypothetical protein